MKIQRKILLINPNFQLTFLAYMLGFSVVAIGVFYIANLYFFAKFQAMGVSVHLPPDHVFFQFLDGQKHTMNMVFLVTAFVSFLALTLGGLFLSHRVSGPLHRLHQHMLDVAAGKTTGEVQFRKGDFFQELPESYNEQYKFLAEKKSDKKAA